MRRRILMFLAGVTAVVFFTHQVFAEHTTYDIGDAARKTLEGLGAKFVFAVLIASVAAIVCSAILRKR